MQIKATPIRLSDAQRLDWLRLIRSENVGPRTFRALIDRYGGAGPALEALPELARRGGAKQLRIASLESVEREIADCAKLGVRIIAFGEPEYPPALRKIDSAPPILLLHGREEAMQQPALSIVGSRNASAAGLTFADRLARALGNAGYIIVSGLARGIDQRAHVASLATGTIGVLAGGHAKPYPPEAAPLLPRIAEFGAIISEMPPQWEPRGSDFPRRNRLVSGLSLGLIVIEAARGSGTLITAKYAADQGREVFAVPGSPLDPRAEGTNDLLRDGANICTRVEDVLAIIDPMRARDPFADLPGIAASLGSPAQARLLGLDSAASLDEADELEPSEGAGDEAARQRLRIIELLGPSPVSLDDLARSLSAPMGEVRGLLLELDLAGRLEFSGGDRVALRVE